MSRSSIWLGTVILALVACRQPESALVAEGEIIRRFLATDAEDRFETLALEDRGDRAGFVFDLVSFRVRSRSGNSPIRRNGGTVGSCLGVFVAPQAFVTAAHCLCETSGTVPIKAFDSGAKVTASCRSSTATTPQEFSKCKRHDDCADLLAVGDWAVCSVPTGSFRHMPSQDGFSGTILLRFTKKQGEILELGSFSASELATPCIEVPSENPRVQPSDSGSPCFARSADGTPRLAGVVSGWDREPDGRYVSRFSPTLSPAFQQLLVSAGVVN